MALLAAQVISDHVDPRTRCRCSGLALGSATLKRRPCCSDGAERLAAPPPQTPAARGQPGARGCCWPFRCSLWASLSPRVPRVSRPGVWIPSPRIRTLCCRGLAVADAQVASSPCCRVRAMDILTPGGTAGPYRWWSARAIGPSRTDRRPILEHRIRARPHGMLDAKGITRSMDCVARSGIGPVHAPSRGPARVGAQRRHAYERG